ncbi:hypothetical protein WA026_023226 [Henosepilachna vigintioctopunctata]|uniref:C2H2-type domain-containing protein n=1 Tax=Henosepilachna vigintioctopunctata TaxID=420089 RepID=A0AAW1VIU5_9CUCU
MHQILKNIVSLKFTTLGCVMDVQDASRLIYKRKLLGAIFDSTVDRVLRFLVKYVRKSSNMGTMIYACSRCEKRYSKRGSLHKHMKYDCQVEKKFQCTMCSNYFKRKETLNFHMKKGTCMKKNSRYLTIN